MTATTTTTGRTDPLARKRVLAAAGIALLTLAAGLITTSASGATGTPGASATTEGCGKAPALTSGTRTITSSGKSRTYILSIPDGYDRDRPHRVVFGFHWLGGTANDVATGQTVQRDVWSYYGLKRLAGSSTIFVAPQGFNNGWANNGGEDITLVDDIVRQLDAGLCVDTAQRFATGFSYGGAMSYSVACSRPTVFRAVAVIAGGVLSGCAGGTQPIAYLGIHGLRDSVLNISGGRSMRDRFVRNNGCAAQNPPEPSQGSLTHRGTTYTGCRDGYPVRWVAFDEGHIAAPQDNAPGDSGTRTWAPEETWRFFTQFAGTGPDPTGTTTSTTTTTTTPGEPQPGACRVAATVNAWGNGLTAELAVTNTGTTQVQGWSLEFALPAGQVITSGWNASYAPNSGRVTARDAGYNAAIPPGGRVSIGYQVTHSGDAAPPSGFSLNGAPCTMG